MNKRTFMLMVAALFVLKAAAQEIENKQRTLLIKTAATWCPPCGGWGWNLFEGMIEDNEDKALLIAAHHSGDLMTEEAVDLFDNFGATYQPFFFLNEMNLQANSSNASAKRVEIAQTVSETFLNQMPVANVGFVPKYANSKLSVDAKVKFFQPASGEYYLSIFLMEDGIINYQASIGNNAVHKKIIRFGFTDNTFGELITNGAIAAGQEFTLPFELLIGGVEGYDYEVAGIIWKKENNKFLPVNVWSTKTIETVSAVSSIGAIQSFIITPNITGSQAVINLELQNSLNNASIDIIDIHGKAIANISQGTLSAGLQTFSIDKSDIGQNGLYFVRVTDGKNVSTRRIIFQ